MQGVFVRTLATIMSVSSVLWSSFVCAEYGDEVIKSSRMFVSTPQGYKQSVVTPVTEESNTESETTYSIISYSEPAITTAAKNGKKAGKVIEQFFTPYNANTKSGNIYVNNQSGLDIDIKKLKNLQLPEISTATTEPQVLIVHTHATENYVTTEDYYLESDLDRTADQTKNVIGVGNEVERVLKKAGIGVIHDKTLHDDPSYSGSYARSAATVEKHLKKHPTIKVVLDIHRDAIGDGDDLIKPVAEIKGKNAAQVMVCVGSNTGSVDYYPNWQNNLSLGLQLQETLETLYPGLARALYVAYDRCWNQNLSPGSLIIEFGTNGNTFQEAKYSATLVGNALVATLS